MGLALGRKFQQSYSTKTATRNAAWTCAVVALRCFA